VRRVRLASLTDAVSIHLLRFAVMWAVLEVSPLVGITGWYAGLAVNVVITMLAAAIMTRRGLWVSTGMVVPWRSGLALAALAPFVLEVVAWAIPDGVVDDEPGLALWLLTLLLVGLNEEMFSRGIVLTSLRRAYHPLPAVAITGALFGLQHLSALVLTSRAFGDVAMNVLLSATFGFALAAYQLRFAWLWPLALLHGLVDWTTVLTANPLPDWAIGIVHTFYLGFGLWLVRAAPRKSGRGAVNSSADPGGSVPPQPIGAT
jgi:membrane protease YdiL (CAAX protease family)